MEKQKIKLKTLKDFHNYIITNSERGQKKRGRPKGILKTRISFRICDTILDNMKLILKKTGIKKVDYINEALLQYNEKMMDIVKKQLEIDYLKTIEGTN